MRSKIDWHCHTQEGSNECIPVEKVVERAKNNNLTHLAITDHNSCDAVDLAKSYAGDDLKIIPGIELDAVIEGKRGHILCFYPDYQSSAFKEELQGFNERRSARMYDIVRKFESKGLLPEGQTEEGVNGLKNLDGSLTRLAVADVLIATYENSKTVLGEKLRTLRKESEEDGKSLTYKVLYAFLDKKSQEDVNCYIGYESQYTLDYTKVVDFCLRHKGVPGFAHLCLDVKDRDTQRTAIENGLKLGMMFIGYRHPDHNEEDIAFMDKVLTGRSVDYKGIKGPIVRIDATDFHNEEGRPDLGEISSGATHYYAIRRYADALRRLS